MAENKNGTQEHAENIQAIPVAKPSFWQKYKGVFIAVATFVFGGVLHAIGASIFQQRQLGSDAHEIENEPIDE